MKSNKDEFLKEFESISTGLATQIEETPSTDKIEALKIAQRILNQIIFIYFFERNGQFDVVPKILKDIVISENPLSTLDNFSQESGLKWLLQPILNQFTNVKALKFDWDRVVNLLKKLKDSNPQIMGSIYETYGVDLDFIDTTNLDSMQINDILSVEGVGNRRIGAYYTPEYIARSICRRSINARINHAVSERFPNTDFRIKSEQAISSDKKQARFVLEHVLPELRLIDPSCGTGAFLIPAIEYINELYSEFYFILDLNRANNPNRLKKTKLQIIKQNITGIDFQSRSIEILRQIIFLMLHQSSDLRSVRVEQFRTVLEAAFIPENALTHKDRRKNWYSVVLGNPPWGSLEGLPDNSIIEEKYGVQIKNMNSFELFLFKGLNILVDSGILCYIIPRNIIRTNDYKKTRCRLLKECEILSIIETGQPFTGIAQETIILELKKVHNGDIRSDHEIEVYNLKNENPLLLRLRNRIPQSLFVNQQDCIFNIYLTTGKAEVLNRVFQKSKNSELSHYVDHSRGIEYGKTGELVECQHCGAYTSRPRKKKRRKKCPACNEPIDNDEEDVYFMISESKIANYTQPILVGKQISRYRSENPLFLDKTVDGVSYKSEEIFKKDKILIMKIADSIKATLDTRKRYTTQALYMLSIREESPYSLKFLLGLLNSRLMAFVYENLYNIAASLTTNVTLKNILRLPIPNPPQDTEIIEYLVDVLLSLGANNHHKAEELFQFFDEEVLDYLVCEVFFKEIFTESGVYSGQQNLTKTLAGYFSERHDHLERGIDFYRELKRKLEQDVTFQNAKTKINELEAIGEI